MKADRKILFAAVAHRVPRGPGRSVVLVDWTQACGSHVALVAAVPIGGRAVPIYAEAHPLRKLGNRIVEKRFINALKEIVPAESRCLVVSDAGFKGPFFQAVLELGWDFLGRIRGTTKAISAEGKTISKSKFYARATTTPTDLGTFELFVRQRIPCRMVLVRNKRRPGPKPPPLAGKEEREFRASALDPWLLATSLSEGDATEIVRQYAKRMQIEETFRDAKNQRFGWSLGTVRLSTPQRAGVLSPWLPLPSSSAPSSACRPSVSVGIAPFKPTLENNGCSLGWSSLLRSSDEEKTPATSATFGAPWP